MYVGCAQKYIVAPPIKPNSMQGAKVVFNILIFFSFPIKSMSCLIWIHMMFPVWCTWASGQHQNLALLLYILKDTKIILY